MIARNDLLAYLIVLNHKPTLDLLSEDQKRIGNQNMIGCLHRVFDAIENESYLKIAIKKREDLNAVCESGHPLLEESTAEVATLLHAYMLGENKINTSNFG